MATFNFYINGFLEVSNYCGTITVTTSGSNPSLGYLPGGPCTGGANDQAVTIPITVTGTSFTGAAITIGGIAYTAISGTFSASLNGWAGTLTLENGSSVNWQSLSAMAFPYGDFIFMVYNNSAHNGQFNQSGGSMVLGGQGNGMESVVLTVGSSNNSSSGSCNSASSQLNFGQCVPGPTIALPNGVTYTFQQMRYAFTSTDGRAVLWGNLQISTQTGDLQFVAIQWPALALPGTLGWSVFQNSSPTASGNINFNTMQYTNSGGQSFGIAQGAGLLTFTDTSTSPPTVFTGIPQVTINGPGNSTNPSSHPTSITWNFGGITQQTQGITPPPGDDGVWDSSPQNGQIETSHALGRLPEPPAAKSQYA